MKVIEQVAVLDEGDIVRIVAQSRTVNAHIPMVGKVGYVEHLREIDGQRLADFQELRLDGGPGGWGSVPVECLEHVPLEEVRPWREEKERRDREVDRMVRESQERTTRFERARRRAAEIVADQTGEPPERVTEIVNRFEGEFARLQEEGGETWS